MERQKRTLCSAKPIYPRFRPKNGTARFEKSVECDVAWVCFCTIENLCVEERSFFLFVRILGHEIRHFKVIFRHGWPALPASW